jgi:hypothetical protein
VIKPLRYDRHAIRRMKWRNISREEIEAVMAHPDNVERAQHGRLNAFRRLGNRNLKVTYKELPEEFLIISAVDKSD